MVFPQNLLNREGNPKKYIMEFMEERGNFLINKSIYIYSCLFILTFIMVAMLLIIMQTVMVTSILFVVILSVMVLHRASLRAVLAHFTMLLNNRAWDMISQRLLNIAYEDKTAAFTDNARQYCGYEKGFHGVQKCFFFLHIRLEFN